MERFGWTWEEAQDVPLGVLDMLLRQPRGLRFGGLTTGEMDAMERL